MFLCHSSLSLKRRTSPYILHLKPLKFKSWTLRDLAWTQHATVFHPEPVKNETEEFQAGQKLEFSRLLWVVVAWPGRGKICLLLAGNHAEMARTDPINPSPEFLQTLSRTSQPQKPMAPAPFRSAACNIQETLQDLAQVVLLRFEGVRVPLGLLGFKFRVRAVRDYNAPTGLNVAYSTTNRCWQQLYDDGKPLQRFEPGVQLAILSFCLPKATRQTAKASRKRKQEHFLQGADYHSGLPR